MNLNINQEFQALIPPLSSEELAGLEESILKEGCREVLITWNNYIIDGHHRYAICQKYNLPFKTIKNEGLETELDVKIWMIKNQFSRRNLSIEVRLALAYQFKEFEAEKARSRQGTRTDLMDNSLNISPPVDTSSGDENKGRTLEVIAKMAGVGRMTAAQYDKIQTKGT